MAHLQLHGVRLDVYEALPLEETTVDTTAWKSLHVDGVSLTFFRPRAELVEASSQHAEVGD